MIENPESMRELLSGYLDGELDEAERRRVEAYLAESRDARRELEELRLLSVAASSLNVKAPPEEVWDRYLDSVYNRLERRTGWMLVVFGLLAAVIYAVYHFVADPWASTAAKITIAVPAAGFVVLFVSVLRQRLIVLKSDRYSREIRR